MEQEWHKIISFGGSQSHAFEEMVCQIAMSENNPPYTAFERVGSPDGGVECFCTFADGSEHGWQAKYYQSIDSTAWNNIKQSLLTATNNHPKLTRYYICLPHNLADGGKEKNTQKKQWENYRDTWTAELLQKGIKLNLVLWNSSTILNKLLLPVNIGVRNFFLKEVEIKEDQLAISALTGLLPTLGPNTVPISILN
jgi:hypothetical protein